MANILIVDDDLSLREVLEIALVKKGHRVWKGENSAQAWELLKTHVPDLVLLDLKLGQESGLDLLKELKNYHPDLPVVMITAFAETQSAVEAMKLGAADYISKPFDLDEFSLIVERILEASRLREENIFLKGQIKGYYGQIIGQSKKMQEVFDLVKKIAPTEINVLITGESGTGKELIARAIHNESGRKDKPFLAINCGGLPDNLIESELFGYSKGAFTGADRPKKGLLEAAEGGTVFLDEVAELKPSTQVKLLRCIQERCFIPLGAVEERHVDVRFIAATNKLVEQEVAQGNFREDLYYRLSGVIVNLPPLRERGEDILLLARYFLQRACAEQKKNVHEFTPEAEEKLLKYTYPGNVRELENIVERAVALETGDKITPNSLVIYEQPQVSDRPSGIEEVLQGKISLDDYLLEQEKEILEQALERTNNHKSKAADLLGLNLRQFRYRLSKVGLTQIED
jgi:two-component system response regulator PilR (NtrC family)